MQDLSIKLDNVSKVYRLGQRGYRSLRDDFSKLFKKMLIGRFFTKSSCKEEYFWALNGISFEVKRGEALGIIGPNGAGKSTILKLLARITLPTSGKVEVNGKTAAMIELGAGFHPELTGRENIYLFSSIMGIKNAETKRIFDSIVEFAELKQFIDTPVKRYSSGMYARIGFSIAVHVNPDILLIDEVLSVGDTSFQKKCIKKMEEFKENKIPIIFISHNLESVRKLCRRTILLEKGKIIFDGATEEAISKYYEVMSRSQMSHISDKSCNGICEKMARITDIQLFKYKDIDNRLPSFSFRTGDKAIFRYSVFFDNILKHNDRIYADFGFFVRRSDRVTIFDTSTRLIKTRINGARDENKWKVEFTFHVNLLKGSYYIGTYVGDRRTGKCWDYVDKAVDFYVTENICYDGIVDLKTQCLILTGEA